MSTFTQRILDAIEGFFSGTIWSFVKPFIESIEKDGGHILIAAAQTAVTVGFAATGGGEAKMLAALASFSAEVVANGLPFIESQARALIEVALQQVKAATSTEPSPAPVAA